MLIRFNLSKKSIGFILLILIGLFSAPSISRDDVALTLEEQIVAIKGEMIQLGREIKLLEDVFLYPPENKVALYLAMNVGKLFTLQKISLVINEEPVADYVYSGREESGLKKGAAQRIYIGNHVPGDYELRLVLYGIGPHGRQYKRAVSHKFTKDNVAKMMQVVVYDDAHRQQPAFIVEDVALCQSCK